MAPRATSSTTLLHEDEELKTYSTYVSIDPREPVLRSSAYRKKSFINQFVGARGAPQIVVLLMVIVIGMASTISIIPAVMTDRYARLNHGYSDERDCSEYYATDNKPEACLNGSADAQNAAAFSNFFSECLTFLTGSVIGSLSDQYGRKKFLLMGILLSVLSPLFLVLIQVIPEMSPSWYYGVGVLKGLVSWVSVALASLSDVMPEKWRAASFGILLAGVSLGICIGPQISLMGFSHLGCSIFSTCFVFMAWILAIFYYPETLPPETAIQVEIEREDEMENLVGFKEKMLFGLLRPLRDLSILNRSYLFRILSLLAYFSGVVIAADQTLLIYYVEERLNFNDKDVASLFMISGLLGIFVQAVILKPLNGWVGEKVVVVIAFSCGTLYNALYGIATNKATLFVGVAVSALAGMAFPTVSAIKANNVEKSEQGRIQGALFSVQALASATGPLMLRYVYHKTKDTTFPGPGTMFLFAAGLFLIATFFACALPNDRANSTRKGRNNNINNEENEAITTEGQYSLA